MAVSLVGEVVNTCDATTGFSTGSISTDDDAVEGNAIGVKNSAGTVEMYTTSLGASAPYDFSVGGSEEGYHIIMWFNSKSIINASAGFRIVAGNGTSRGNWYVVPRRFYKGGFVLNVVDPARDFDVITAGSWATNGNPAQLTSVSQIGGGHQTPSTIMGSFNNFQLDKMTVGLGLRVDADDGGVPNTFETVRAADEDTNFWGWWSSRFGSIVGRGKLYIGPATGSASSSFSDSSFKITFADEPVAIGFYEINPRGAGTDVDWTLGSISAENSSSTRWNLTVDSDTNSFADTDGNWSGADTLIFNNNSTLTRTKLADCNLLVQNGATLDGCQILAANTADDDPFIYSDDPSLISDCDFTFSDGHAIKLLNTGTYSFVGNTFTGYGGTPGSNLTEDSGSTDAAIYNDSGGLVTLNISGGGTTPSVRNGPGSTTVIASTISLTVTPLSTGSEVRAYLTGTSTEVDGTESSTGSSHVLSLSSGVAVDIVVIKPGYESVRFENVSFTANQNFNPVQRVDRNFWNP